MSRSRLGPLALEAKLGSHPSQSSVWSAVHVEQRIRLAIKVFSIPLGGTLEAREDFAREWERLKKLQHPGIARCYGGGFEEADAYLAMELVEGETLADQIERRGRLPWETVLDYADGMIAALAFAHGHGIVHGALEPDKVMIEPLGQTRIIDFRANRFDSPYRTNRPPSLLLYACRAPEMADSIDHISAKCDLYSLGAICYFALTGRLPISGSTLEAIADSAATELPEPVGTLVMECPVWFSSVIDQLLDKAPDARPFGAEATQLALAEVRRKTASGVGVAEHASGGFSPLKMKVDKEEAKQLLGRIEPSSHDDNEASFYERSWFLLIMLFVLGGIVFWFMMPPSESKLRSDAQELLATESRTNIRVAKDRYLIPLVNRFPDGDHFDWAMDQIDEVDMMEAEYQLGLKLKHGRTIRNEAERLYSQAREYEQFGDLVSALDQYKGMVTLLDADDPKSRPYVNLAKRQINKIEGASEASGRAKLVDARLTEADSLDKQGRQIEARKIWYSIVELYAGNQEMQRQVEIAQQKLGKKDGGKQK